MSFIENLYKDEIRSGFLVRSDRKKVWEKELEIWSEFNRICRKYDIQYFADSGTLLGAVRHNGFIPWDDDFDVAMLRPEYERFKEIAATEISAPYFFQNTYTDNRVSAFSKIMDLRTSAIEDQKLRAEDLKQGIFIDIFPLDTVLDQTPRGNRIFSIQTELWACVINPDEVYRLIRDGANLSIERSVLEKLLAMTRLERMREFETFCLNHFEDTDNIGFFTTVMLHPETRKNRRCYSGITYMPFETVEVPVPIGYDECLTQEYGDYRKYVMGGTYHEGIILSADIPYKEYLERVTMSV